MTPFNTLPPLVQTFLLFWYFSLIAGTTYAFIRMYWLNLRRTYLVLHIVSVLLSYFQFQVYYKSVQSALGDPLPDSYASILRIPWITGLILLPVLTAFLIWSLHLFHRLEKTHTSVLSIKASLDALPIGLCYYTDQGSNQLINTTMESYLQKISPSPLYNLLPVLKQLEEMDPPFVVHLNDSRVILFRSQKLESPKSLRNGHSLNELIALDVSSQYAATAALQNRKVQIQSYNDRLKELNSTITNLTIQKEILTAKTRLHNDLGALSLSSRMYLQQTEAAFDAASKERIHAEKNRIREIRQNWERTYALLEPYPLSAKEDEYQVILKAAEDIGFTIRVTGTLPEAPSARHVLSEAMHETMVNAMRHGGATSMDVVVTRDTCLQVSFTNNGTSPEGEIHESGGLANLRSLANTYGYSMQLKTSPAFCLTIILHSLNS